MLRRAFLGLVALSLSLVGVQVLSDAPAVAAPRVVYYDTSRAGEFATNFAQAAQIWNSSVTNVRLQTCTPATVVIHVDSGWPRAYVTGLGSGRIYIGRQAVDQGYNRGPAVSVFVGRLRSFGGRGRRSVCRRPGRAEQANAGAASRRLIVAVRRCWLPPPPSCAGQWAKSPTLPTDSPPPAVAPLLGGRTGGAARQVRDGDTRGAWTAELAAEVGEFGDL